MMRELLYGARPNTGLGLHRATYDPSCQDALALENVVLHYVLWEIPTRVGMDNLPPSLHPTWPGLLVLQSWRVPDSPVGPFAFIGIAVMRIQHRAIVVQVTERPLCECGNRH